MYLNFSKYSDSELYGFMVEGKASKETAFCELYNRYSKKIYLYCKKILSDNQLAEVVYLDVFVNFSKSAENKSKIQNIPGYLFKIARNLCLNCQRTEKLELIPLDEISENELYEKRTDDLEDLISSALELLPHDQREALVMQMYLGMSYNEIAQAAEVPMTTIRNRIVRAKMKMKEILSPFFAQKKIIQKIEPNKSS